MIINTAITLAVAAGSLAAIATTLAAHTGASRRTVVVNHPPIVSPSDVSEAWSAHKNVTDSKR